MNVISVMREILLISNPMIRESALPNFPLATDNRSERVRISALDQLHCVFKCYALCWCEQKMNMFRHDHEGMNLKSAFATITVHSLQKKAHIIFHHEQSAPLPG